MYLQMIVLVVSIYASVSKISRLYYLTGPTVWYFFLFFFFLLFILFKINLFQIICQTREQMTINPYYYIIKYIDINSCLGLQRETKNSEIYSTNFGKIQLLQKNL